MNATASPWPRRTAYLTAFLTIPLLLLGGTVTTLRVGMAVPDWPTTFGQNMFTYPLESMLENWGVFFEHTHRLAGSAVGLASIAMLVAHLKFEKRGFMRVLAVCGFLAVCVQGILGGMRVLQNSQELAGLHGTIAQAVFALLGSIAVMQSSAWQRSEMRACKRAASLRRIAVAAPVLVFVQIAIGAWLRHSGNMMALGVHALLAVFATIAVILLAKELRVTAEQGAQGGHDRSHLLVVRKRLVALLATQLALGVLAAVWVYIIAGPQKVTVGEAIFATLHVVVGALLLLHCVSAALWAHHVVAPGSVASTAANANFGGAR